MQEDPKDILELSYLQYKKSIRKYRLFKKNFFIRNNRKTIYKDIFDF